MKNIYLLITVIILSVIGFISSFKKETTYFNEENKELEVTIKNQEEGTIETLDLEEYIIGVVAGEMPASFEDEALKAQAIAARSYALNKIKSTNKEYDLLTDITNQVYITKEEMQEKWQEEYEKYYDKIKKAVEDTKNLVMMYEGEVITAYYFAMSNGKTEDVSLVFGENIDYLVSVDSSWDENVKNFLVTNEIEKEEFCEKLDISCEEIKIEEIKRTDSNRVDTIKINGKEYKGTKIRALLNLRSTDFDIEIKESINITTRGYGHGVGMSQYGANEMAKNGATYEEILKYYYKDINLTKINV